MHKAIWNINFEISSSSNFPQWPTFLTVLESHAWLYLYGGIDVLSKCISVN